MKKNFSIIVSSCLLGCNTKYNGKNNESIEVLELIKPYHVIPVCPEQLGGLETPRVPAEIEFGKSAKDILNSDAKIYNKNKKDVTVQFVNGAYITKQIIELNEPILCILKEFSPSCSNTFIYDGTFSSNKVECNGITVELIKDSNIPICNENQINKIKEVLNKYE